MFGWQYCPDHAYKATKLMKTLTEEAEARGKSVSVTEESDEDDGDYKNCYTISASEDSSDISFSYRTIDEEGVSKIVRVNVADPDHKSRRPESKRPEKRM